MFGKIKKTLLNLIPLTSVRRRWRSQYLCPNERQLGEVLTDKITELAKMSGSMCPVSNDETHDRGYILDYVARSLEYMKGDILEFYGTKTYRDTYASADRKFYTITSFDYKKRLGNVADFYCDFEDENTLPGEKFDCILATQTLCYAVDIVQVLRNLKKMLRGGGATDYYRPGQLGIPY
ncbi:hypothetical protein FACS1894107_13300 [Planctomycetales bacterium]|nr:hypothetical protein FACS1894107_13300 [Planctomycetales bacterium]